jgi:NTE family protein
MRVSGFRGLLLGALGVSVLVGGCRSTRLACPLIPPPVAPTVPAACPAPVDYPFTNLVFEGGGVKGLAYGGALEVLEQQGILARAERVAGTSAGSITALAVALGYTASEVRAILTNTDFTVFEKGGLWGPARLVRRFGWFSAGNLKAFARCLVAGRMGGNARATFADLAQAGKRELVVFVTDLETGKSVELSAAKTPDVELAEAVRLSGSFPVFFAAGELGGSVVVDGGVLRNYPITAFDDRNLNPKTLGFVLLTTDQPPPRRPVGNLVEYSKALFEAVLSAQVAGLETDPANLERTAILDDLGISTLDFKLSDAQKQALIASGARCTCEYLKAWQGWQAAGRSSLASLPPGTRIPLTELGHCGAARP